jgi:two-component system, cell cycle response regulator DivK
MLSQRAEVRECKAVPMGIRRGFYTAATSRGLDYDTEASTMAKILLVEDNEMNRDMLSRRLQRKGFVVVIAEDGKSGVALAASEAPDLILLDMSLPLVDGWEAARQIKAGPTTKDIPIIALTAHAMAGDREKALDAGCDEYDTKPVEFPRLLTKIEGILRSRSR